MSKTLDHNIARESERPYARNQICSKIGGNWTILPSESRDREWAFRSNTTTKIKEYADIMAFVYNIFKIEE